jgi:hypothetical protein
MPESVNTFGVCIAPNDSDALDFSVKSDLYTGGSLSL